MLRTALVLGGLALASTLSAAPRAKGVDVAIIGGGPCGLATALAVQRVSPNAGVSAYTNSDSDHSPNPDPDPDPDPDPNILTLTP